MFCGWVFSNFLFTQSQLHWSVSDFGMGWQILSDLRDEDFRKKKSVSDKAAVYCGKLPGQRTTTLCVDSRELVTEGQTWHLVCLRVAGI